MFSYLRNQQTNMLRRGVSGECVRRPVGKEKRKITTIHLFINTLFNKFHLLFPFKLKGFSS